MPQAPMPASNTLKDYRDRYEDLTGSSLWKCPICHQGRMLVVEVLARVKKHPEISDSS